MASITNANTESLTEEDIAIKEVRARITDVIAADAKFNDDLYLLQWLKAQKLNPEMAEGMIRKSIKWRQEQNIHSNLHQVFDEDFLKEYFVPISKTKTGIPVVYVPVGSLNFKKAITKYGKNLWIKYWWMKCAQFEEEMIVFNKSQNRSNLKTLTSNSARGLVGLVNAKNFSSLQLLNLDVLRSSVEIAPAITSEFPAVFENLIFYNMNAVFKTIFVAVKPFLVGPGLTIEVYGSDEKIWRERLLQIINLEDLQELENHRKQSSGLRNLENSGPPIQTNCDGNQTQ
ncbi:unnamed protein product [Allacma fusca]|uniref:CRAL-TRIO domain-containing protein n=1 Tax=Allacma fusca TaxID=39272 RepID=A0A8J2LQP1_9HEXA|nr:unnamed protein product [Allacma fusca]